MKKSWTVIILGIAIICNFLVSCTKKDTSATVLPDVDHSLDSLDLLATGKGFKKVYGYVEPTGTMYFPGTINEIHGLDLTIEGVDKVNFAFSKIGGSQQGPVKTISRATANFVSQTLVNAPTAFNYTFPTGSSWQELGFSYAPYSNLLGYMYYSYSGPGYVSGDISEPSGQSLMTTDRRIAKTGHSVYSIVGSQGQGSATETNGFTYGYYNASGNFVQLSSSDGTFSGIQFPLRPSSEYVGVFEPITSTNEGIVVLYSKDSVTAYLNNLNTPAVKFTSIGKAVLTNKMSLNGYSIVKNNANDNNFSFAFIANNAIWTFTFSNSNKTLNKVIDGAILPTGAKSVDIDENGNFYYFISNSIFKNDSQKGVLTIAQDLLSNGSISLIKYYQGKVFVLAERFKNANGTQARRQIDVLIQE